MLANSDDQEKDLRQKLSTKYEGGETNDPVKVTTTDLIVDDDQENKIPQIMVQNEMSKSIKNAPIEPSQYQSEFSFCTGLYVLFLFSMSACTTNWTKGAMAQFYGYGVQGKSNDP